MTGKIGEQLNFDEICSFVFVLSQVQFWVETQVLLTQQLNKRVYLLKKFIKLAAQ